MKNTKPNLLLDAYFKLEKLKMALLAKEPALDANHQALLEQVAMAWHQDSPMTVMQAINLAHLGSPATLHRRLKQLRSAGFLSDVSGQDSRIKYVVPTDKAQKFFTQLGAALKQAAT